MRTTLQLAALLFILTTGCTREPARDSAINLVVPVPQGKVGTLAVPAGFYLGHIVVNVHGGSTPVVWTWDRNCGFNCTRTAPTTVEIKDLESGVGRTVQYLGVYENPTTSANIMFYGEAPVDLKPGANSVPILATQYGSSVGYQANIIGQYVDRTTWIVADSVNAGQGPTGKIEMVFKPTTSEKTMLIEQSEMFNGWVNLFGISGIPLQYRLAGTETYLVNNGGRLTLDDIVPLADSAAHAELTHFISPANFWVQDSGGGSRRAQNGGETILGFFGPSAAGVDTPKACYPSSHTFSNVFEQQSGGNLLAYCPGGCTTENVQHIGNGGYSSACGGPSNLVTSIDYKPDAIQEGHNGLAPFQGPFAKAAYSLLSPCSGNSGYKLTNGCYYHFSNSLKLRWNYVPHVFEGPNAITGATLFLKQYPYYCQGSESESCTQEYRKANSDGYNCAGLADKGFVKYADYVGSGTTSLDTTYPLSLGSSLVAILCPYREGANGRQYFESGAEFRDLRAPLPPVNNLYIKNSVDTTLDSYLVDSNLGAHEVSVQFDAVSGASQYDVKVLNGGSTICSSTAVPSGGATISALLSGCASAIVAAGAPSYSISVDAFNSNNRQIAQSNPTTVYYVSSPPVVTSVTASCSQWGAGPYAQLDLSVSGTGSISTYTWYVSWVGDSTGTNSNLIGVPYAPTINAQTGMLASGNYAATITVTPVHSSGYQGAAFQPSLYILSGTCP